MKQVLFIVVILSFVIACNEKPKNPIAEYGDAMIDSYKRGQAAGEAANLDAIRKTIRTYYVENERYPESLDEIAASMSTKIDTSKYDYNPQTGMVSIKGH